MVSKLVFEGFDIYQVQTNPVIHEKVMKFCEFLQVERAAESCATAMASVLPTDIVTRVLNPIVKTGDFPVNQAAVKMMTKVADHAAVRDDNREFILANLHDIMPGLIKVRSRAESIAESMGFRIDSL